MTEPSEGQLVTSNIRLVRPLGAGGMGAVWLADHLALHTHVVVKFITAELAKNTDALSRFKREAAAAAQVKSPHVVQTLDHGVREDGTAFIVMEYLEGHDLSQHLDAHGKLPLADTLAVVSQLSRALIRAHERGIVHRDLKPSNVFLCDAGGGELFVKLLDFGIAKGGDMPKLDENTKTGAMVGSPHYMSPEQIVGDKNVDFRSDLWSLGVVTFEALTGQRPFDADTIGGLAIKIHTAPLPAPTSLDATLPQGVDGWFERACAREPAGRFASAKEMADALAAACSGSELPARSLAPARLSASGNREIELAKTAFDDQPASLRSSANEKVNTGVGVAATLPPSGGRGRWIMLGGALAVGATVAFFGSRALRTEHPSPEPSAPTLASQAPGASAPPSAAMLPAIVTSAPASASAIPSATAAPRPSTHPTTKPTAKPINPDDDIK